MNEPQDQPLLADSNGNGRNKTVSYTEDVEQPKDGHGMAVGFDAGYSSWTDSMQAFHQAIFHFVFYIGLAVLFYSFILETKFTVIESIYFAVCIFTTVGYGDISADGSAAGMAFTIFFALYGIIILGIFLGILGDMAVERQQQLSKELSKHASTKFLNKISNLSEVSDDEHTEDADKSFLHDIYGIAKEQRMSIVILLVLASPVFILEKWSIERGIYWFIITATTVGLGDEYPEHEVSKLICIFYVPLAVAFGGSFLGQIATAYVDKRNDAMEAQFLNRALCESALDKMDTNHDNRVTKDEFLVYMLKTLDKVDMEDVETIMNLFETLDKDGSGELTREDIQFIPDQTAKQLHRHTQKRNSRALFRSKT